MNNTCPKIVTDHSPLTATEMGINLDKNIKIWTEVRQHDESEVFLQVNYYNDNHEVASDKTIRLHLHPNCSNSLNIKLIPNYSKISSTSEFEDSYPKISNSNNDFIGSLESKKLTFHIEEDKILSVVFKNADELVLRAYCVNPDGSESQSKLAQINISLGASNIIFLKIRTMQNDSSVNYSCGIK